MCCTLFLYKLYFLTLQARNECNLFCKWLLVNVQNTVEFACQVMNRDVWSNKVVREIMAENFILWQVEVWKIIVARQYPPFESQL